MCFLLASSCAEGTQGAFDADKHDLIDADQKLSREDFRKLHDPKGIINPEDGPIVTANVLEPPIPDLAEILAAPKPPKIGETQLVSVAVTDDVPLKDVLIELARLADVDIEVDAGITGGINFRAKDRPFNEVIERIAELAGLRYKVQYNVLRVERDMPYIQTYKLDMLNIERSAKADISVNSTGGSGKDDSSGSGSGSSSSSSSSGSGGSSSDSESKATSGSGSSSSITAESKSDFWAQFDDSIKKILTYQKNTLVSSTTIATQPAQASPSDPSGAGGAGSPAPAPQSAATTTATTASSTGNSNNAGSFYSLNRQAGVLTVSATERQHETIKRFIDAIVSNASSQVLIEAKIVEVTLNDRYQTGINWAKIGTNTLNFTGDFDPVAITSPATGRTAGTITFLKDNAIGGTDLSAAVKLLNEFGTTRALSSPRLNAVNNQQAVLSFVENLLYFEITCEVTDAVAGTGGSASTPAKVEVTSTPKTAPVGIVLTLQPSINKDTNEVTLSVRPTLTRVTKLISDPGFQICKAQAASTLDSSSPILATLANVDSQFPQLESRELDSILKVRSNQIMVIGGLLEDSVTNTDAGIPGVSEVPYLGNFFKSVDKVNKKKELAIFIRATIVDSNGYADQADKAVYQKFIQDPRPIGF